MSELFYRFRDCIASASENEIRRDVTLGGRLVIDQADGIQVSYAPFEHIQRGARVVIVGITPGAQQAVNSLIEAQRQMHSNSEPEKILECAKVFASFSGPMRSNLVAMLDSIGLQKWIGVPSIANLWNDNQHLAHFTSALRYPVFVKGENYSGQPKMTSVPILMKMLMSHLREEAVALPKAVWIPLGPRVSEGLNMLVKQGILSATHVLDGLPHPSGANAERIAYFLGKKDRADLSRKTNSDAIDAARSRLTSQVASFA